MIILNINDNLFISIRAEHNLEFTTMNLLAESY